MKNVMSTIKRVSLGGKTFSEDTGNLGCVPVTKLNESDAKKGVEVARKSLEVTPRMDEDADLAVKTEKEFLLGIGRNRNFITSVVCHYKTPLKQKNSSDLTENSVVSIKVSHDEPISSKLAKITPGLRNADNFDGNWEVCISIDPRQMEKAIPIVLACLRSDEKLEFNAHIVPKEILMNVHGLPSKKRPNGKEIIIHFSPKTEADSARIKKCLEMMSAHLKKESIRPDEALISTAENIPAIIKDLPANRSSQAAADYFAGRFYQSMGSSAYIHYRAFFDEKEDPTVARKAREVAASSLAFRRNSIHNPPGFTDLFA